MMDDDLLHCVLMLATRGGDVTVHCETAIQCYRSVPMKCPVTVGDPGPDRRCQELLRGRELGSDISHL